ncbi:hypothetical protein LXA43DRAFT_848537, partial [Ganoderma leucocontextum]
PITISTNFLIVVLNLVFKLNLPGCRFVLRSVKAILRLAFTEFTGRVLDHRVAAAIDAIPSDPSTALRGFDLEPTTTLYACCPTCFALYPP